MPAASIPRTFSPALPPLPPHRPTRTLHLAAAIDGREPCAASSYVELARLAESGALDFVTLGGGAGRTGGGSGGRTGEDGACGALDVLARVAPATDRIGLVPAVAVGHGEPFDLALAVATLDWVSHGRAGWTAEVLVPAPALGAHGSAPSRSARPRRSGAGERTAGEAIGAVEAVAGFWDGAGGPRPSRGRPVVAVDATDPAARATAARHADIAFVRAARPEDAGAVRAELRELAARAGRDPERLRVLAELSVDLGGGELGPEPGVEVAPVTDGGGRVRFGGGPVDLAELIAHWQRSGAVDGFHVRPVEPRRDLERFVNGTVALLQHRGLFRSFHPGATLREHLGLHRPEVRFAVAGETVEALS